MRIARITSLVSVVLLGITVATPLVRGAFTPPKDNTLTEKQITGYIDIMKQWLADQKAAQKALEGQNSGLTGLAVVTRLEEKRKASIVAHGMTEDEFNWVATAVGNAKAASFRDQMQAMMKSDIEAQVKANQDKLAEMKNTLATYQKTQAAGKRVMTPDERKSAIDSATEDLKSALDEAKQHADEAKAAQADADKADADQKAAESALKNPPKFDSDDDKNNFVQEKQAATQSAKDAKKEAQDKVAEAKKAEAESRAKAASAAARIKDPDVPVTDEDKAAVKQQNEDKVKEFTENIKQTEEGNKLVQEAMGQQLKVFGDVKDRPPEQSVTLFKKHEKEYDEAFGLMEKK